MGRIPRPLRKTQAIHRHLRSRVRHPRIHEHACIRCPMLRPDPSQHTRFEEIRDNLLARIAEAEREGWHGETEGLQISLTGVRDKLSQITATPRPVSLGMPAFHDIAGEAQPTQLSTQRPAIRAGKHKLLVQRTSKTWQVNAGWVLAANIAADLAAWTRLLGHGDDPGLRDADPGTLRYRIWHLPARLARHARQRVLAISTDWPWKEAFLACWQRLCALPAPS